MNLCKLTLIILILFFATCKKDTDMHTTVKGVVKEEGSLKPIADAVVYLEGQDNCFSCGKKTIATTKSASDGTFTFDFTAVDLIYSLAATKSRYFDNTGNYGPSTNIKKGEANNLTIMLEPEAYLKIHIKNTQPFDNNDMIRISGNCCDNKEYYGTKVDTYIKDLNGAVYFVVRGNKKIERYWVVIKNGVQTNYTGSIYCPAHDTTTYNINY